MPSSNVMANPDSWAHYTQNILDAARVLHLDPEVPENAPEDLDPETLKKELESLDPYEVRLKSITKDSQVVVGEAL